MKQRAQKVPLRVLRIQETSLCGSQKEKGEQITTHMVTTADKVTLPTESAWRKLIGAFISISRRLRNS